MKAFLTIQRVVPQVEMFTFSLALEDIPSSGRVALEIRHRDTENVEHLLIREYSAQATDFLTWKGIDLKNKVYRLCFFKNVAMVGIPIHLEVTNDYI